MSGDVQFAVNFDSPVAVYTQIENQIIFAIASGRLRAGDRAPSGRDMALLLGINPNTVMKAYRDLEIMGIVESRRGVGVTITEKAARVASSMANNLVSARLRESVGECLAVGMKPADIKNLVAKYIQAGVHPYSAG